VRHPESDLPRFADEDERSDSSIAEPALTLRRNLAPVLAGHGGLLVHLAVEGLLPGRVLGVVPRGRVAADLVRDVPLDVRGADGADEGGRSSVDDHNAAAAAGVLRGGRGGIWIAFERLGVDVPED